MSCLTKVFVKTQPPLHMFRSIKASVRVKHWGITIQLQPILLRLVSRTSADLPLTVSRSLNQLVGSSERPLAARIQTLVHGDAASHQGMKPRSQRDRAGERRMRGEIKRKKGGEEVTRRIDENRLWHVGMRRPANSEAPKCRRYCRRRRAWLWMHIEQAEINLGEAIIQRSLISETRNLLGATDELNNCCLTTEMWKQSWGKSGARRAF